MKNLLTIVAFHLAFTSYLYPQFSLDKFLKLDWSLSEDSIKKEYSNHTFEYKEVIGHHGINAIDSLKEFKIKFGFLLTKENMLRGKSIKNIVEEKSIAQKLYEYLKSELITLYGKSYKEVSQMGVKMLMWKLGDKGTVSLTIMQSTCMLTVVK